MMQDDLMPRSVAIRSTFGPSAVSLMYVPIETWRHLVRLLYDHYELEASPDGIPTPEQVAAYNVANELIAVMRKSGIDIDARGHRHEVQKDDNSDPAPARH